MQRTFKLAVVSVLLAMLTGCATMERTDKRLLCAVVGGLVGGTLGAIAGESDEEEIAIGAGVIGAGLGYLACNEPKTVAAGPGDADGDGVTDDVDACPNTPRGAVVDARGCPQDSDGDGVFDGLDRCPGTPAGTRVDNNGCPLDSDGDGVHDGIDACPNTPRGTPVDARGCPQAGQTLLRLEGVNFAYDSATLTSEAQTILDQAVTVLRDNAAVRVRVEGHTDSRGSEQYNQSLSERRAQAVVDYLVGRGVAGTQLQAQGFGESRPVAPNDSDANMARNRRVDFVVAE